MTDLLLSERVDGGVLLLTINRADRHNAVTLDMQRALDEQVRTAADDPEIRCIVLAGAGGKAFSAGYDIHELSALDNGEHRLVTLEREELLWRWLVSPVPTVVACTGITYGVGMLLAACADVRVGGPGTRMKVTATAYGGANLTWLLDQLLGAAVARDMLLSSRLLDGSEAFRVGLVTRYVPDIDVVEAAVGAAREIAANDPVAVREVKRLMLAGPGRDLRARYDEENTTMRTTLTSPSTRDRFASFFKRRPLDES